MEIPSSAKMRSHLDSGKGYRRLAGRANKVRLLRQYGPHRPRHHLSLFEVARKEWCMEGLKNPVRSIRLPSTPSGRDCRLQPGELEKLLECLSEEMGRVGPLRHGNRHAPG